MSVWKVIMENAVPINVRMPTRIVLHQLIQVFF